MNKNDFKELVSSFQEFSQLSQKGKGRCSSELVKRTCEFEKHLAVFSAIDRYCYVIADITQLKLVKAGGSIFEMTGYEPSEFENKSYHKLLKVHTIKDLIKGAIGGSKYFKYLYAQPPLNRMYIKANRTVDLKCKNGTRLHCLAQSIPIAFNDKMEPIFFLNLLSDLSQIKSDNSYSHYIVDASNDQKIITIPIQFNKKIHANSNSILSAAEIRVLQQLAKGNSSKQIAELLFISEHTVKNHRKSMLKKYECSSSAELVTRALIDGII